MYDFEWFICTKYMSTTQIFTILKTETGLIKLNWSLANKSFSIYHYIGTKSNIFIRRNGKGIWRVVYCVIRVRLGSIYKNCNEQFCFYILYLILNIQRYIYRIFYVLQFCYFIVQILKRTTVLHLFYALRMWGCYGGVLKQES